MLDDWEDPRIAEAEWARDYPAREPDRIADGRAADEWARVDLLGNEWASYALLPQRHHVDERHLPVGEAPWRQQPGSRA